MNGCLFSELIVVIGAPWQGKQERITAPRSVYNMNCHARWINTRGSHACIRCVSYVYRLFAKVTSRQRTFQAPLVCACIIVKPGNECLVQTSLLRIKHYGLHRSPYKCWVYKQPLSIYTHIMAKDMQVIIIKTLLYWIRLACRCINELHSATI